MSEAVDLPTLATEITTLGNRIAELKKADEPDKDAIASAVKSLLEAKQTYADNNDGLGVDGKKYERPLTKAEKKAKAKAEKAAAAAAGGDGGDGGGKVKEKADPNSAGAKKKAAKKAEAKAKKAAAKAASSTGSPPPTNTSTPSTQKPPNDKTKIKKIPLPTKSKLRPNQLSFSPNTPLPSRPVASLLVATLTSSLHTLSILPDHKRNSSPSFGLSSGNELVGDVAIARLLARRSSSSSHLLGGDEEEMGAVDAIVDYANELKKFQERRRVRCVEATLNHLLKEKTWTVGSKMTLADVVLFTIVGFPSQIEDYERILSHLQVPKGTPFLRWLNMMKSHPAVRSTTQLALQPSGEECAFSHTTALPPLLKGMQPLEGATPGNVVTRFPPEPSGYLHVGHAKAVLMNEYYARRYGGRLIVRFDDTNPSKEREEFQESILEDLGMLGVRPDVVTFTSDYFGVIRGYAEEMVEGGLAFMDDTKQEEMQRERMERVDSKHRGQSVEECKRLFALMCSGDEEGKEWCLRAKIDMKSVNGTMRDPVIFRQNTLPHHRSGDKFKAYPTYDLACPIVDSIEGVTHALRTTEYNDRDEQYAWIQGALNLRRVRIHAFARMNFQYTELSKRKLGWFVDNNVVSGWDDARFPTVRGVIRRGVNLDALRNFICSQGASRRIVNMEWGKFWAENKKEIDKKAKRFMAIDKSEHVKLTITNGPEEGENSFLSTDFLPKDASFGKRLVRISKEVILEKVDTEGMVVGEDIVLMRWGVVKITKVEGGLEGEYDPNGDFKAAKRKLSWISDVPQNIPVTLFEFDNLIVKEKLEEGDDFKDFINPNTMASSEVVGDVGLKSLQKDEIIQLERRGYYRVDRPYQSEKKGLVLFMVPDGKAKAMSGLAGKLAHR